MSARESNNRRSLREELAEWQAAGWAIQDWIRSCFDQVGICALCGSTSSQTHYPRCPWPRMRALLDRSPYPATNGQGPMPGGAGGEAEGRPRTSGG